MQLSHTQAIADQNNKLSSNFTQALGATRNLAVILGALSLLLFLINIHHGIGILPDTTRYMGIAEEPYDAPVYAWLLRASGPLGLDLTTMATAVATIVLGLNVVLLTTLFFRLTGRVIYTAVGSALVLFSPHFVTFHSLAMSEPLFLALLLLTLHLSLTFLQTDKWFWLVLSGLALGAATLTRFTAPPLGAALVLAYLLNGHYPFARRIRDAAWLFVISSSIFFVWVAASHFSGSQSIGRELSFFGTMGVKEWYTSLAAMAAWLLPDNVPDLIRHAVLFAVLGTCAYLAWKQGSLTLSQSPSKKPRAELILVVLAFFFPFYIAFLLLASALEANLHINGRYGFPAYVTLVLLATSLAAQYRPSPKKSRVFTVGLAAFAVLILSAHFTRTAVRTYGAYHAGIGYNSLAWKLSPTIARVGKIPVNSTIYSNGPDAIAYLTGKPIFFIPRERLLRTNLPDSSNPVSDQLAAMRKQADSHDVFVVFLDQVTWRSYLVNEQKLKEATGMELIESFSDGRIYKVAAGKNTSPASQSTAPEIAQ